MAAITPDEARANFNRWKQVREQQTAELRRTSVMRGF
jgi:hypothetical protein